MVKLVNIQKKSSTHSTHTHAHSRTLTHTHAHTTHHIHHPLQTLYQNDKTYHKTLKRLITRRLRNCTTKIQRHHTECVKSKYRWYVRASASVSMCVCVSECECVSVWVCVCVWPGTHSVQRSTLHRKRRTSMHTTATSYWPTSKCRPSSARAADSVSVSAAQPPLSRAPLLALHHTAHHSTSQDITWHHMTSHDIT